MFHACVCPTGSLLELLCDQEMTAQTGRSAPALLSGPVQGSTPEPGLPDPPLPDYTNMETIIETKILGCTSR